MLSQRGFTRHQTNLLYWCFLLVIFLSSANAFVIGSAFCDDPLLHVRRMKFGTSRDGGIVLCHNECLISGSQFQQDPLFETPVKRRVVVTERAMGKRSERATELKTKKNCRAGSWGRDGPEKENTTRPQKANKDSFLEVRWLRQNYCVKQVEVRD